MKYRNIKTGAVINVSSKISGDNWMEIPSSITKIAKPEKEKEEKPKKRTARK